MFNIPFKLTYKGKVIPGFIIKVNTDANIDINNTKINSIKEDIIPAIEDISQSLLEEINDN